MTPRALRIEGHRLRGLRACAVAATLATAGTGGGENGTTPPPDVGSIPAPSGWSIHRNPADGVAIALPPGWRVSMRRLTPRLLNPLEILAVGNEAMPVQPAGCDHMPGAAVAAVGKRGSFLSVQEYTVAEPGELRRFPLRHRLRLAPRAAALSWACTPQGSRARVWWIAFRSSGRAFYVLAALGPTAGPTGRHLLERVLGSLRFESVDDGPA